MWPEESSVPGCRFSVVSHWRSVISRQFSVFRWCSMVIREKLSFENNPRTSHVGSRREVGWDTFRVVLPVCVLREYVKNRLTERPRLGKSCCKAEKSMKQNNLTRISVKMMFPSNFQLIEMKQVIFQVWRGRWQRKGGPKMKVYAEKLMKTKDRFSTASPQSREV